MVSGFLLLPIIYAADGLGIAPMLNVLPDRRERNRRFGVLRSEVMQLLDLVRRLNWLIVDLDRGVRPDELVRAEIAVAEERLDEVLAEIRSAAGRASSGRNGAGSGLTQEGTFFAARARFLKYVRDRVRRVTSTPPRTAVGGTSNEITHGYQSGCPGAGWPPLIIQDVIPRSIMAPERADACPGEEWSETVAAT
jgi:hypothetical protein